MKFVIKHQKIHEVTADLFVLFTCDFSGLDSGLKKHIAEIIASEQFEDKVGNTILIHTEKQRILIAGTGKTEKLTVSEWQTACAVIARKAKEIRAKTIAVALPIGVFEKQTPLTSQEITRGAVEGLLLGVYEFLRHKHDDEQKKESKIDEIILCIDKKFNAEVTRGIEVGRYMSKGTILARDLVNEPSSVTTPTFLSLIAKNIAKDEPSISCEIFEKKDMEKMGMGGILGIAKGSDEDPKLIQLTYKAGKKTIVLVGKGVTFDSGGLSLKSQEGMESMKIDMAGAAAILGIFSVISQLKPEYTVVGIIPAVENMPSGKAIKPGDVVRAYNGKTIEVISTDAEGRVILADALAWAGKTVHPEIMIDLATLTGACMIALGEDIAGLFGTDRQLTDQLKQSADREGEALWELPMPDSYNELLKSDIADIRNVTRKRYGGAITAALFLKAFVPENISWAHLDIAGPAVAEKDIPLMPIGGTGFGVRLLLTYLRSLSQKKKEE